MLKRLPILCAALLALAACSQNTGNSAASSTPASTTTAAAATAAPATSAAPATATTAAPATPGTTAPAASSTTAAAPAAPAPAPFVDNGKWVEGKNYFLIDPAQPTSHPDKIEVTEVFSYACPACNQFHTSMDQLAASLPSNAVVTYLAASFRPDENWPLFQRTYYAARALGVA